MASMTKKSGLVSALGLAGKQAFQQVKDNETTYSGGGDPPAGINGGVAQLVECKFDQYKQGDNTGQWYFCAVGVIKSPQTHNGIRTQGLRTSIMEPLCETPNRSRKSVQDHLDWVLNALRKLGVDTSSIQFEQLEEVVEALKEQKPHFTFRTWQSKPSAQFPDPRVNQDWGAICDGPEDEEDGAGVDDQTSTSGEEFNEFEEEPEAEEPAPKAKPKAAPPAKGKPLSKAKPAPEPEPEPEEEPEEEAEEVEEEFDLETLVKAATKDDTDAAEALIAKGEELGIDRKAMEDAPSWKAVGGMISKAMAEADEVPDGETEEEEEVEEEEEAAEEWKPEVGEVYAYSDPKKINPKTKKPVKVEITLTAVNEKKKTIDAKATDNPKVLYKTIAWDKLESAE